MYSAFLVTCIYEQINALSMLWPYDKKFAIRELNFNYWDANEQLNISKMILA